MKVFRKGIVFWGLLFLGLLAGLPVMNWFLSSGTIPLADTRRLFSIDPARGYINRFLYRQEISGDSRRVVVGRDGWLFPGAGFDPAPDPARGLSGPWTANAGIRDLQDRQRWLTDKGIMTLFVIVPDKGSVYPEYLPADQLNAERNATDNFMYRAGAAGLNVLDLRAPLLQAKKITVPLYYKLDSRWNSYGAYLGYRQTLAALDDLYGARINTVVPINRRWIMRGGGDLARLLKIDALLGEVIDKDADLSFAGSEATICLQKLSVARLAPKGTCKLTRNQSVEVGNAPWASFNQQALNRMNVLWVRDAFGTANSRLYQQTFSRLWEVSYQHFAAMDWRAIIEKLQPDLVIYQVAERVIRSGQSGGQV